MATLTKSELIKLQRKHKSDAAIGKLYGITRQAIHQLRLKHGIPSSRADNPKRNKEIIAMHRAGASGTAIAKKFKLSVSQTCRIINRAKTARKRKPRKKK